MYITGFTLENVRCFAGTHTVSLARGLEGDANYAGWTVIAGRNGSGKTSLLRALAMGASGVRAALSLEYYVEDWVYSDANVASASVTVMRDEVFDHQDATQPRVLSLRLDWIASRPARSGFPTLTELKASRASERLQGWFLAAYGAVRGLDSSAAATVSLKDDSKLSRLTHLFSEKASLIDAIDWLQHLHLRALEGHDSDRTLKEQVLALLNDGLLPDGSVVERVDSDGLWIERDGFSAPVQRISDGYRAVTALVLDLVRHLRNCYGDAFELVERDGHVVCDLPGVVLIDEVDAHMHVSWQQRFGFWMRAHFPRIQFLVTTHSPFVCQAASPRGIIRLPGPGEDRRIEHVSERAFKLLTRGSVDEAVMTGLFGLEHPHSDEVESVRQRLATFEKRLLLGEELTAEEVAEMERLRAELPDTLADLAEQRFRAATTQL